MGESPMLGISLGDDKGKTLLDEMSSISSNDMICVRFAFALFRSFGLAAGGTAMIISFDRFVNLESVDVPIFKSGLSTVIAKSIEPSPGNGQELQQFVESISQNLNHFLQSKWKKFV